MRPKPVFALCEGRTHLRFTGPHQSEKLVCYDDRRSQENLLMWPDRRILDLLKIEHPILLGPMASAVDDRLAIAVAQGGGLGAIPCAMITAEQLREQLGKFRVAT